MMWNVRKEKYNIQRRVLEAKHECTWQGRNQSINLTIDVFLRVWEAK
jgi:hypothetical protein